jgi:hypothetical protein
VQNFPSVPQKPVGEKTRGENLWRRVRETFSTPFPATHSSHHAGLLKTVVERGTY